MENNNDTSAPQLSVPSSEGVSEKFSLDDSTVHVWYCSPEQIKETGLVGYYYTLLSNEERVRHGRFFFERDRHTFLVGKALMRITLSRYAGLRPSDWVFKASAHGRPEVKLSHGMLQTNINLSHTNGMVACVVGIDRELGIDIEDTRREVDAIELAQRFFSSSETTALRRLRGDALRRAFFSYWTLKESYIKARGMGLSIPLDHFAFEIGLDTKFRIAFGPEHPGNSADWQFVQFAPTPHHLLSVCVHRPGRPDLALVVHEGVPGPPATD